MALVFTAIADSLCSLMLLTRWQAPPGADPETSPGASILGMIRLDALLCIIMASVGLYGFGMSLNDIIDRRRDQQLAAYRPLPSGRIGILTAHVICALLALLAILGGVLYVALAGGPWLSLVLVVFTMTLIVFYDAVGKYLVAPGLLTLGLIRFFHATIAAPQLPLLWHPLWLLNHIALLSTIAYGWEQKRPALRAAHWWAVGGGLALVNLLAIGLVAWRRHFARPDAGRLIESLDISPHLLWPLAAAVLFVIVSLLTRLRFGAAREGGQQLMLLGLLWLIVYDAAFVLAYVGWKEALIVLALLPVSYCAVVLMRWSSRLLALRERPQFQRAEP